MWEKGYRAYVGGRLLSSVKSAYLQQLPGFLKQEMFKSYLSMSVAAKPPGLTSLYYLMLLSFQDLMKSH